MNELLSYLVTGRKEETMKRNMKKLIEDYKQLINQKQMLDFTIPEIEELLSMAGDKNDPDYSIDLVLNSARAGYMAGWKAAKRNG